MWSCSVGQEMIQIHSNRFRRRVAFDLLVEIPLQFEAGPFGAI